MLAARYTTVLTIAVILLASPSARAQASSPQRPAPAPQATPPEWDALATRVNELRFAEKHAEALGLLEKFVARNPNVADAHFLLALAHRDLANPLSNRAVTPANRTTHLEGAATHFQRAFDLSRDPRMRYPLLFALADLHRSEELNRPAEAEKFARRMIAEDPSQYGGYALLAQLIRGDLSGLSDPVRLRASADVLRAARKAVPDLPAIHVLELATSLVQIVRESPALPRADAQKLLDEARALFDELIMKNEELHGALLGKALALKTQADRVEQDPKRQAAVMAESDRVGDQAFKMRRDERRSAMTPAERLEDDFRDVRVRAIELETAGKTQEALALYEKFLAAHPDFAGAHESKADVHFKIAEASGKRVPKATAEQTRHLELARTHYQRAIDLTPDPTQAPFSLMSLIQVVGPAGLNRPAEAETIVRSAIKRYPGDQMVHYLLLRMMVDTARWSEIDGVLRTAREAVPVTPERRQMMGADLHDLVFRNKNLPIETARTLVAEAVARLDEALKLKPDYMEALTYKSLMLRLQAERVEKDPARAKALIAEADRLRQRAEALRKKIG